MHATHSWTDFSWSPAPSRRQTRIFYDATSYSAFPHVVRLEGDELLTAFRQAPREQGIVRHTHPRSAITVIRSYDLGQTWENDNATQLAAGGGQELGLIYLGKGRIGGALAAHEVVPNSEAKRSGMPHAHQHEYPFSNVGGLWCWSNNFGLTWRLENAKLFAPGRQCCAPPIRLADGSLMIPVYGNIGRATRSSASLYRSSDGGDHWSELAVIARGRPHTRDFHEPAVLELQHKHLVALHRVADPHGPVGMLWRNESWDGGVTWSPPRPTGLRSGACPRLLRLADGRILLTYGRRFEPFGIYATCSADDGKNWEETHWLLRPTPDGDQGYTSSIELGDGNIFTCSYAKDRRGITGITGTFWKLPMI